MVLPTYLLTASMSVVLALQQLGFRLGHVLAYLTSGGAEDPINGWWIGWSVLAGMLGVVGVLLVMFPPRLPAAAVRDAVGHILREAKATVAPADGARVHISTRRYVIREPLDTALCPSLARVFTNRVAMLKMIAVLFGIVAFGCMDTFKDKYLESIYHIPLPKDLLQDLWLSRITTNLLEPVVSALCVLCSGLVISWRRPRARPLAAWMAAAGAGCALLTLGQVWLGCHQLSVSGEREGQLADFQRTCNAACGCSRDQDFAPVCGVTSRQTYYSPCLAGCTEVGSYTGLLRGCSCVPGGGLAQSGSCGSDACASRWVTLQALWMGAAVLRSTTYVASVLMVLRCLEPEDKSLGIGCLNALVGLIALLPAYFAFRVVTDYSCEYWDDAQYSCKLYHSRRLELTVTLFLVVLLLCSSVLDACVGLLARRVRIYPDTEADEGDDGGGGSGGGGGVAELSADQRQKLLRRRATPLPRRRRDAPEVQLRRREGEDGGAASSDEQDVGDGDGAYEDDDEQELRAVQRLMARSNGRVQPGLATTAF